MGHGGAGAQQGKQDWAAGVGHGDAGGWTRAGEHDTLRSGGSTNSNANELLADDLDPLGYPTMVRWLAQEGDESTTQEGLRGGMFANHSGRPD